MLKSALVPSVSNADVQICHCLGINMIHHNHLWLEDKMMHGGASVVKVTQM